MLENIRRFFGRLCICCARAIDPEEVDREQNKAPIVFSLIVLDGGRTILARQNANHKLKPVL